MEPFLICLPVISADVVATAVPLSATKSASIATAIAGDMRPSTFRKTDPPSVGVSHRVCGDRGRIVRSGSGRDRRDIARLARLDES